MPRRRRFPLRPGGHTSAITPVRRDPRAWLKRLPPEVQEALTNMAPPGTPPRVIRAEGQVHRFWAPRRPRRRRRGPGEEDGAMQIEERQLAARREAWALMLGLRPSEARRCLKKLANPRHRCGPSCDYLEWPAELDHPSLWTASDGSKVIACQIHDADLTPCARAAIAAIAAHYGAAVSADPHWAWASSSGMTLVVLWGRR